MSIKQYGITCCLHPFSWSHELIYEHLAPLMSEQCRGVLSSRKCHCRRQNQVRVHNELSAERLVVQSQQCCNYINMGRITLFHICAFTFYTLLNANKSEGKFKI